MEPALLGLNVLQWSLLATALAASLAVYRVVATLDRIERKLDALADLPRNRPPGT